MINVHRRLHKVNFILFGIWFMIIEFKEIIFLKYQLGGSAVVQCGMTDTVTDVQILRG